MGGSEFIQALVSSEKMAQLIKEEELLVTKTNNNFAICGNWISVEQFRQKFRQFMIDELQKHTTEDFSSLFSSTNETTESSVDPKTEATVDNTSSDGSINAKKSSLNPDVLALMQKTGVYQHSAVSYDLQTTTINIDCDDPIEKEKIKEGLFTAYREIMMGGKLKEHSFPVDDIQQASIMVDELTKNFHHTYFRYDSEKKEIKCLSTDARQMQHVRKRCSVMEKQKAEDSKGSKVKSVFIDLPKLSRRVTIKLGNIVDEEVDVIVNAANERLIHGGGVAAAIDKASYGAVQKESSKLIEGIEAVPTGQAVTTNAGGKLKCKLVVHAVGPIAYQHTDQCGILLHNACMNSMVLAQCNKAKSISFPPISSGIYGVSKELVANVMLSTLCSYPCNDPELLNDVRIVIIDEPTFDVFLKLFHKEKGNLELSQLSQYNMPVGASPHFAPQKSMADSVSIDLPQLSRKVTIKFGDIVQEEVDVIVNAANNHLFHDGGVAAAINKASGGAVQRESTKIMHSAKLIVTGDAVATTAGGTLKCKLVVHAVGPTALQQKDQCAFLLKKTCINAMSVAQNFEAISIAFPPISSGACGVSNELVANAMLSTLCSFTSSSPTLVSDVRVVIIDRPTFEVFVNVFHREKQSLDKAYNNTSTASPEILKPAIFQYRQSAGNPPSFPPPGFPIRMPSHVQPVSYSHAVMQQPLVTGGTNHFPSSSSSIDVELTNLLQPSSQDYKQTETRIPDDASSTAKKNVKSLPVTNEPKHNPNNPDNAQSGIIINPTRVQRVDSNNATKDSANTGTENISHDDSVNKSKDNSNTKDDKHNGDIPIDHYKVIGNEGNKDETVSNGFVVVNNHSSNSSSVDPVHIYSTLQPVPDDPLHGPSPESSSQDRVVLMPKQKHASMTLHTKHLPSATGASSQKEQNARITDKSKETKKDKNEKTDGKVYELHCVAS